MAHARSSRRKGIRMRFRNPIGPRSPVPPLQHPSQALLSALQAEIPLALGFPQVVFCLSICETIRQLHVCMRVPVHKSTEVCESMLSVRLPTCTASSLGSAMNFLMGSV